MKKQGSSLPGRIAAAFLAALGGTGVLALAGFSLVRWLGERQVLTLRAGGDEVLCVALSAASVVFFTLALVVGGLLATRRDKA